jgi:HD-GYP domain-containing protein (c-di-GMP phosphodiesterase class II)
MQEHCANGYNRLKDIPFLREASEIVLAHHEHFDGGGYPRGVKGSKIPLGARVIAVANTFDVLTSDWPYRPKQAVDVARSEIERCAGTQFDPEVVQCFSKCPSTFGRIFGKPLLTGFGLNPT